jgi:hypothetical protein
MQNVLQFVQQTKSNLNLVIVQQQRTHYFGYKLHALCDENALIHSTPTPTNCARCELLERGEIIAIYQ